MVDLDELERLEREATPGPWELEERMRGYGIFAGRFQDFGRGPERVHGLNLGHVSDLDASGEDNLALIIATRNALPDLIAELRTLRTRVAEMERDARLGAVVREAVGTFVPSEVESVEDITISDDGEPDGCREVIIISDGQASILSEIADALRAEEGSDQ